MNVSDLQKLRDSHLTTAKEELAEFDKNFFLVSAGLFAFTVTFIQDIVELKTAEWIGLLLTSWGFLAASLGLIIIAFFGTSFISLQQAEHIDDLLNENYQSRQRPGMGPRPEDRVLPLRNVIRSRADQSITNPRYAFRVYAIVAFLVGLILLSIFLIRNFYKDNKDRLGPVAEKTVQTGSPEPAAPSPKPTEFKQIETIRTDTTIKTSSSRDSIIIREKTTVYLHDSARASLTLVITPDTLYVKALGENPPPIPACMCPSASHLCSPKCKMPRKKAARYQKATMR